MANVLFFGPLADVLDVGSVDVQLNEQTNTVADLINALVERGPEWKHNLSVDKLQVTINRQFADAQSRITNSDEIALIPLPGTI